jgi:SAM-dependent methyltransferase
MFDDLSDIYDSLVDWPRRLVNEAPVYRELFDRCRARRVLDVACGSGRHAAQFSQWGLSVEGADASPAMIDHARTLHGERPGLRWVVRPFEKPAVATEPFDVAICVGNSLALAPDLATVELAIGHMLAAVRGGGLILLHVLNLWRLREGPCYWQEKWRYVRRGTEDWLVLKGIHRWRAQGFLELVVARPGDEIPRTESTPLLALEAGFLQRTVLRAGGKDVRLHGDYQERPYDRGQSVDLILVAEKSLAAERRTCPEPAGLQ